MGRHERGLERGLEQGSGEEGAFFTLKAGSGFWVLMWSSKAQAAQSHLQHTHSHTHSHSDAQRATYNGPTVSDDDLSGGGWWRRCLVGLSPVAVRGVPVSANRETALPEDGVGAVAALDSLHRGHELGVRGVGVDEDLVLHHHAPGRRQRGLPGQRRAEAMAGHARGGHVGG